MVSLEGYWADELNFKKYIYTHCLMMKLVSYMHPRTLRLCLSIIPAIFAYFLVSVFAMALVDNGTVKALIGVVAAVSSSAVIIRH
jgi:hypothetical protein